MEEKRDIQEFVNQTDSLIRSEDEVKLENKRRSRYQIMIFFLTYLSYSVLHSNRMSFS